MQDRPRLHNVSKAVALCAALWSRSARGWLNSTHHHPRNHPSLHLRLPPPNAVRPQPPRRRKALRLHQPIQRATADPNTSKNSRKAQNSGRHHGTSRRSQRRAPSSHSAKATQADLDDFLRKPPRRPSKHPEIAQQKSSKPGSATTPRACAHHAPGCDPRASIAITASTRIARVAAQHDAKKIPIQIPIQLRIGLRPDSLTA